MQPHFFSLKNQVMLFLSNIHVNNKLHVIFRRSLKKQFMKNLCLLITVVLIPFLVYTQDNNKNIEKLGSLSYAVDLNDIWGYATETSEYALVGLIDGFSIADVTNPNEPTELHHIPGANSTWRDIKTWKTYAYGVNETDGGCVIIDMSQLPESIETVTFNGDSGVNFNTAHNVYIDEKGYMYIVGSDFGLGGCIIYDLNENPTEPKFIGLYDVGYVHDLYARDNLLYTFEGADLAVVDITDPANPIILGKATTYGYTHNGWVSDDGNTLFSTDETAGTWVVSWDISDPTDIKELDKWQSSPGEGVIPHNAFVLGDYVVTSYYTDGVTITDASKPNIMVEVGNYDTSEFSGGGFFGAWGVYPYLPSGNLIASDIEEGLFVLKPSYKKAGYIIGKVVDAETGEEIFNAKVLISEIEKLTDFEGVFSYGNAETSVFDITISKLGYEIVVVNDISLTAGETTEITIELKQQARVYNIEGTVFDASNGDIVNTGVANLSLNGEAIAVKMVDGQFKLDSLYLGKYQIQAGSWGYYPVFLEVEATHSNQKINIFLNEGVYDDFAIDYGWTSVNNSYTGGEWELTDPIGYNLFGFITLPSEDVADDFGNQCYVTGDNSDFDFVAGGQNTLSSPTFDCSAMENPFLSFYSYFANFGYFGSGNQTVDFVLTNGTETTTIDFDNSDNADVSWKYHNIKISDFMEPTNNMQFKVVANGPTGYELLESGFDVFQVVDSAQAMLANSVLTDDVLESISANSQKNTIDILANDNIACDNPEIYLVSYDSQLFKNTSIDENGILSFDVSDFSESGNYQIVYAVNCGGLDNNAAKVGITIIPGGIPAVGAFNCN